MGMRKGSTVIFPKPPVAAAWAAVGGKKEGEGPLAAGFDRLYRDNLLDKTSWEQAEATLLQQAAQLCIRKGVTAPERIDLALAGDLQAQCTASGYAMRQLGLPFCGLYGACSTMAESLALAACLCSGGVGEQILAATASHFCAAERQFRTPLNYGGTRTPTAQWTATAAGCVLVRTGGAGVPIRSVTFGRIVDLGVKDINNMGAAMAPAAADTILRHLRDTGRRPGDFDRIFTGDLGRVGTDLLCELTQRQGVALENHRDCGCLLYHPEDPRVRAGGSGCGCSAAVLGAHILPALKQGEYKRVLFIATGALMSQTTFLQKESIPGVAHLVELAAPGEP